MVKSMINTNKEGLIKELLIMICDIENTKLEFMHLGLVRGRNLLKFSGFVKCKNPMFYVKNINGINDYWHYNHIKKYWIHN